MNSPGAVLLRRLPPTRSSGTWDFVVPLLVAAAAGAALAFDARLTLIGIVCLLGGVLMLAHLECAALVVVASAVFEDYLTVLSPATSKVLALLLVGAWIIRRGERRLHDHRRSPVLVVALAFFVALLIAFLAHNNGAAGLDVVLRYVGFLAVLVVLVDVMRGGLSPHRVARVYVASCSVAAVCGLTSFVLVLDRRVGGPIGDPNDFAFFLLAALPLALTLRSGAARPWIYDIASGVLLLALVGTTSRGALVGLAGLVVVGMVTQIITLRQVALGLVASVTLGAIAVGAFPDLVETTFHQKSVVAGQNVSERVDLWRAASDMTLESPVLGQGPGAFALYHQDYADRLPDDINHDLDVAHNTYLEVSSELGVVGVVGWLALLATALVAAWASWSRARGRDQLAGGVLLGLVGACISSFFVTEQYTLPIWLLMALAAALMRPASLVSSLLPQPRSRN